MRETDGSAGSGDVVLPDYLRPLATARTALPSDDKAPPLCIPPALGMSLRGQGRTLRLCVHAPCLRPLGGRLTDSHPPPLLDRPRP